MGLTLDEYRARVSALLVDGTPGGTPAAWSNETVTAGIRQALGELNLAAGTLLAGAADGADAFTISGLDGEAVSTVPGRLAGALCWGAAGCAALLRGLDELEKQRLQPVGEGLQSWGAARVREYRAMLAAQYPGYAPAAGLAPAGRADPANTAAEAARLADLRRADAGPAWGTWKDSGGIGYPGDYETS